MSVHGGNLREAAEQYGIAKFLDFSANINPLGVPMQLTKALYSAIENDLTHYPDPDCVALRMAIAAMHSVDISTVLCGNGASEILFLAMQTLNASRVLIPKPSFVEYEAAAMQSGAKVTYHMLPKDSWKFDANDLPPLCDFDALIIGNPNNPTSTICGIDMMCGLAKMCLDAGVTLIIDEAFIELTIDGVSMCKYLDDFPNLLIVRAFTKSLAIPGLRLGYALGNADLLKAMHARQITWSVNALAQSVAHALGDLGEYMQKTSSWLRAELPDYYEKMRDIEGITCFEPHTNFMMWKTKRPEIDLRKVMASKGILIRPCGNFVGLDSSYFRTAISSRENNEILFETLRRALNY